MKRGINFLISRPRIDIYSISVKSRDLWNLPDGKRLYRVEFHNSCDIIAVAENAEVNGAGRNAVQVKLFDMPVSIRYIGYCCLYFDLFKIDGDTATFTVGSVTEEGRVNIGSLRTRADESVLFNGKEIATECARRSVSRALLLLGKA